jgi:hypothetical protein
MSHYDKDWHLPVDQRFLTRFHKMNFGQCLYRLNTKRQAFVLQERNLQRKSAIGQVCSYDHDPLLL